ncbi:MAG: glycosyltransferase, partial [Flavobacteriales bacterium]
GNMSYPPNITSVLYIADEILPRIQEKIPSVRFLISGASPSYSIRRLGNSENIEVTGWVEDIRYSDNRSKLFLAPIVSGAGMQNKLLEAMSMEMVCITSQLANNAIGATHEEHLIVCKSAEEYVEQLYELIENYDKRCKMAQKARRFATDNFSWNRHIDLLNKVLKKGQKLND